MREIRGGRCIGILEVGDIAFAISYDKVGVAIAVKVGECRRAVRPHRNTVQWIVRAGAFRKTGDGRGADVLKIVE